MAKIRVHELAKELGMNSRDLVNQLLDLGIQVKNHFSTLEESEVAKIKSQRKTDKPLPDATKTENRVQKPADSRSAMKGLEKKSIPKNSEESRSKPEVGPTDRFDRKNQRKPAGVPNAGGAHRAPTSSQGRRDFRDRGSDTGKPTGDRSPSSRPQGVNRPQIDRAPGRPFGDRPPSRPPGDRPGSRPPGDRASSRPPGDRTTKRSGDRAPGRPPFDRPGGRTGERSTGRASGAGLSNALSTAATPVSPKTGRPMERDKTKIHDDIATRGAVKGVPKKGEGKKPPIRPHAGSPRIQDDEAKVGRGRKRPGRPGSKKVKGKAAPPPSPILPKVVTIGKSVTVQELASVLNRTPADLIKRLMMMGVMVTATQAIDFDTAALVCDELGVEAQSEISQEEALLPEIVDDPSNLVERPPVVTVMGHVDHGKTSLLDAIRRTRVTATEAGGITQHIGAYQVEVNDKKITFIDTPGHEAFTAMRARGAQVTDIAILVVAADDGVMPQTIEAINHARAAEVPIIVAVNKMDKPTANPERIKQQLTEYGLLAEDWGGDTICVPVSAHTREGLDTLLEMVLLVAEMTEFKANPDRPAEGTVIEAQLDKGRGPVATVLVRFGTLRIGDSVLVGVNYGKVRAMVDHHGQWLKEATPSTPVEVLGLDGVPMAGDIMQVVSEEKIARQITESRQDQRREEEFSKTTRVTLDDLFKQIKEGQIKELNLIIKGDAQGSIEALRQSLEKLGTEEVKVSLVHTGVGTITESDVMLASASNAIIIGFNVRPDQNTRRAAENEQVDIRLYRVIYEVVEDIRKAMGGLLEPDWREVILGRLEVRATFKVPKIGIVAGGYVLDGKILRGAEARVIRDGIVIQEGKVDSLRRFKDDVKEVVQGFECGVGIENFNDIKEGDVIEAYIMEKVERTL